MATPSNAEVGSLDEEYEEYVEFQCPLCQTPVTDNDPSCPGCGAIFVDSDAEVTETPIDDVEVEEDYELDEDIDYDDLDEEALEAELEAMETGVSDDEPLLDDSDSDVFDLDLSYEDDLVEEEEIEEVFGTHVEVEAEDHVALEEMSKPTLMERTFQRMGLGLFIAGGVATVMVVLWDPINGNPITLGMMQWRFLVLALSMFIVGFAIEMLHAASLAKADDMALQDLMDS